MMSLKQFEIYESQFKFIKKIINDLYLLKVEMH